MPSVAQRFPNVARIRLLVALEDSGSGEGAGLQELCFWPDENADFDLRCSHRECVDGGFHFDGPIAEAVAGRLKLASGMVQCAGWQDAERKHRCPLAASYDVAIDYVPG